MRFAVGLFESTFLSALPFGENVSGLDIRVAYQLARVKNQARFSVASFQH